MTRLKLAGQRILITGASSGIGRELARLLYSRGCRLLLTARRGDRLMELAAELEPQSADPTRVAILAGDITDPAHRGKLFESVRERFGGLEVLINNAGIGAVGLFHEADPQRLRTLFEVNFFAPAELSRLAISLFVEQRRGLIVNVGSVLAFCAVPKKSEYCASKFALRGFSDALRIELADLGIEVLSVHPNTTQTEFFESLVENQGGVVSNPHPNSAASVAERIVSAINHGRAETILTTRGKALAWGNWMFPGLARKLLRRFSQ